MADRHLKLILINRTDKALTFNDGPNSYRYGPGPEPQGPGIGPDKVVKPKEKTTWFITQTDQDQQDPVGGFVNYGHKEDIDRHWVLVHWKHGEASVVVKPSAAASKFRVVESSPASASGETFDGGLCVEVSTAPRSADTAPGGDNAVKPPQPGLAARLHELAEVTGLLKMYTAQIGAYFRRAAQLVALTRGLAGFVNDVLMEPAHVSDAAAAGSLWAPSRALYLAANEDLLQSASAKSKLRWAREYQKSNATRLRALVSDATTRKLIDDFGLGLDDEKFQPWMDSVFSLFAEAIQAIGNSSEGDAFADVVATAVEGGVDGPLGLLFGAIHWDGKLGEKLLKVASKSVSASRGSDSLWGMGITYWFISRHIKPTTWLSKPTAEANLTKFRAILPKYCLQKLAALDKEKVAPFREAVAAGDFQKAKTISASAFSPGGATGTAWKFVSLAFKLGDTLVGMSKLSDTERATLKDGIDAASAFVGTSSDTVKFIGEIGGFKSWGALVNKATPMVGTFAAICTVATGGIAWVDAANKVDGWTMAVEGTKVMSGTFLLLSWVFASSAIAGPFAIAGVGLGVIATIAGAVIQSLKSNEEKAFELLLGQIEDFAYDPSQDGARFKDGRPMCKDSEYARFGQAVTTLRSAYDAMPARSLPAVRDTPQVRAVLARFGLKDGFLQALFPPAPQSEITPAPPGGSINSTPSGTSSPSNNLP